MWRAFLLTMLIGAIWTGAYYLKPHIEHAPTLCTFRLLTGVSCPTCGMTRATCALAHGQWSVAMAYHPLVTPFWLALVAVLGTHLAMPASVFIQRWRQVSLWAFLAIVAASVILRMGEWVITAL